MTTLLDTENKTTSSQACGTAACNGEVSNVRYGRPAYRIQREDSSYGVTLDVPGVGKDGVDLTLEDGVLEIKAQRAWKRPEGWKSHRSVEKTGYLLKLELSDDVDSERIEARLEDGVLRLNLVKKEETLPRKIKIA